MHIWEYRHNLPVDHNGHEFNGDLHVHLNSPLGFRFESGADKHGGPFDQRLHHERRRSQGILIDDHYISGMNIGIMGDAGGGQLINSLR